MGDDSLFEVWKASAELDESVDGVLAGRYETGIVVEHADEYVDYLRLGDLVVVVVVQVGVLFAELAQAPGGDLDERLLGDVVLDELDELIHRVELNVGHVGDEHDEAGHDVVADVIAGRLEHARHLIDVPRLARRVLLHGDEQVGRAVGLELGLARAQERHELVDHLDYVGRVYERKAQLHGASLDRHVRILEALDNGATVALYRAQVGVHHLEERVERHVANVLVGVEQEAAEDVDGEDAQRRLRLDVHDGEHGLVQDRVAGVLARLGVGAHLGEYVVHGVAGVRVVLAEYAEQADDAHLQERIADAGHVVVRAVAGEYEVLEDAH